MAGARTVYVLTPCGCSWPGATGVIGTPLVPQLLEAGHEVTAMTRSVLRAAQLEAVGADPVVCDVFDADGVRAAMADASPDAVIHQLTRCRRGSTGATPVFDEQQPRADRGDPEPRRRGARRGRTPRRRAEHRVRVRADGDPVKEEDAALFTDAPPPFGGVVAALVEHEQRVTGTAGIEGLVLRYGLLYGPGTWYDRRGTTAADILAGRVPLVEGATGMYSWLHVDDAASAAVAALERGGPGIYNVVDDEPAPQPEWLPVLAQALRADPPAAAETPPPPEALEMSLRGASNAKAKRELGWRPRYASWREGFAASLA